jgi:IMP dehydrogenase
MKNLHDTVRKAKELYENIIILTGNVANPKVYSELSDAGADYIRMSVGSGSACLTSVQTAVGYPLGSLIKETYEESLKLDNPAKIVADGGIKNYSDIIKCLALGADYVMLGGIFNKSLESSGKPHLKAEEGYVEIDNEKAKEFFESNQEIYKQYRGMSTKSAQKELNRKKLKTSEGIIKYNKVEYTLKSWLENFDHYLKSSMSYTNCRNLDDFIGKVKYNIITQKSFNRIKK